MQAFDETPSTQICRKVEKLIDSIQNPRPPNDQPILSDPNNHFMYSRESSIDYPEDLYALAHSENVCSGWIPEIQSFWAANTNQMFLFSMDLQNIKKAFIPSPVVCAGFFPNENRVVISYNNSSLGIFSYPDFTPLKCSFSIPRNVSVTTISHGIVGCNDGSLRKITLNSRREHLSVSGILSISNEDPIVDIVPTKNYYFSVSLKGTISVYSKDQLHRLASCSQIKNVLTIWCPCNDKIFVLDNNTILFSLNYSFNSLKAQVECQLLERRQFQTAIFRHGFLTAIDSSRPTFDLIFTARFSMFPVYTLSQRLGGVFSIGCTSSSVVLFTSSGIFSVSEKLTKNENEEIWRFANVISDFWNTPITDLPQFTDLIDILNHYFISDFEQISNLSKYILTAIDDIRILQDSEFEKLFSETLLHDLFTISRTETFSRLRKISFEIRFKNQEQIDHPPTELEILINNADAGDVASADKALNIIASSFQTLPPSFPIYCEFMLKHKFYRELLDAIIAWARSVLPDENALAFENANFPTNNTDDVASYHLRLRIYEQMNPFLSIAISGNDAEAQDSLKYILNFPNEVFQRFVLQYLEDNCSSERVIFFTYPEMIDQMKMIKSRHLPTIYQHNGLKRSAFEIYIETACADSDMPINERVQMLKNAKFLYPQDENVKKLLDSANLLTDFILTYSSAPQNLFAKDFIEINDTLVEKGEYVLAIDVMKIYRERRIDVLDKFLEDAESDDVKVLISKDPIFTQSEIAHELYHIRGKVSFDFMFDCQIDNKYIFEVLCELWRCREMRQDIEIIVNALQRAGPIHHDIRKEVADMLCEIIIDLDASNKYDDAEEIRYNLEHCFLDQKFEDIFDF